MTRTVFYAWQSDLPAKTNRDFIREALVLAIQSLNTDLSPDDALRPDQDTKGVPGTPTVADAIFEKIRTCSIFLADITTVTPKTAARPSPNPNVLIEYGRATVQVGDHRVILVFNEAFGDWEKDRPFDLRHKRKPFTYYLSSEATKEERAKVLLQLKENFIEGIRSILTTLGSPQSSVTLPNSDDFSTARARYAALLFPDRKNMRSIGFWCALRPLEYPANIGRAEEYPELLIDRRPLNADLDGQGASLSFETIDQVTERTNASVRPVKGGVVKTWHKRFPTYKDRSKYVDDVVEMMLGHDGTICFSVKTTELSPAPQLNMRWIIAEAANALRALERMRSHMAQPKLLYAMLIELRFDDSVGNSVMPIAGHIWKLCDISDEQMHVCSDLTSDPKEIGPILVQGKDSFPEVLTMALKELYSLAERRIPLKLSFTGPF